MTEDGTPEFEDLINEGMNYFKRNQELEDSQKGRRTGSYSYWAGSELDREKKARDYFKQTLDLYLKEAIEKVLRERALLEGSPIP